MNSPRSSTQNYTNIQPRETFTQTWKDASSSPVREIYKRMEPKSTLHKTEKSIDSSPDNNKC
jgi:hypothetical protein